MRISIPSNLDFELSHLQQRAAAGERFKYVFFWGHTPSKNEVGKECLSQWYASPFDLDGITYRTAEHFMMAEKARLFGDQTKCAQIIEADSPGKAKALGREVVGFDQDRWEAHRIAIAIRGNVAKFSRHQGLGEFLRNTGTRVLVEASPRDRI